MLYMQFLKWPLEAGSKNRLIPTVPHIKKPKLTAEINMSTMWYKNGLCFFSLFPH